MQPLDSGVVVSPEQGETMIDQPTREIVLLAEREDVAITWARYAPGERGPDPHVHRSHSDCFYVLNGELTLALGPKGERTVLGAGGFVAVPANLVHFFLSEGSADVHFLNFHAPQGGFPAFLRGLRQGDPTPFDSFPPPEDGGLPADAAIISPAGAGERLVAGNRTALVKCALADISVFEFLIDGPFRGPDLHRHDDQVDSFYVLEGELEVTVEGVTHTAGSGTLASVPRNFEHAFSKPGDGRTRMLNVHAPDAGFAEFLRGI